MHLPRAISLRDATVEAITEGLRSMRWMTLPSERCLAVELKVSRTTIRQALAVLADDGVVSLSGKRRKFRLAESHASCDQAVTVDFLSGRDYDLLTTNQHHMVGMAREEAIRLGYRANTSFRSLSAVRQQMGTIEPFIRSRPADARVVMLGHWNDLEWLSRQPEPVLAIGGPAAGLNVSIAAFGIWNAVREAMRTLTSLGHRRIVMCCLSSLREVPQPGKTLQAFFDGLNEVSITPSSYNLPAWNDTAEDLYRLLDKLFRLTPPTAIFVDTPVFFATLLSFCNERGIRVPEQLSVVAMSKASELAWFHPSPSVIETGSVNQLAPLITDWLANFRSFSGPRVSHVLATFTRGGTIGPAPGNRILRGTSGNGR